MSYLDKLEEVVDILCSVTLEEMEELPPHVVGQLAIMAVLHIKSGLGTDPTSLATAFMQVFVLGQRSAIDVPNWED